MFLKKNDGEQSVDEYIIRKATSRDAKGIIECMQSVMDEKQYLIGEFYMFTERGEQERIRNPDDLTLVSENNGTIVGVLTLQRGLHKKNRHTVNLGIAIKSGHRHLGVGTRLIQEAQKECRKRGIEKINLEVFSTNLAAISAYTKLGFRIEGSRKGQFIIDGKYVDDVLMTYYTRDQEP